MDLEQLELTPDEISELNEPFTVKNAAEAIRHGVAQAISDAGLNPSDFEKMAQELGSKSLLEHYGDYAGLVIGAGALAGAGTGYLRHRANQAISGKDDPDLVTLKKKIQLYRQAAGDIKSTMQAA